MSTLIVVTCPYCQGESFADYTGEVAQCSSCRATFLIDLPVPAPKGRVALSPLATPADTRPTLTATPVCTEAQALDMAAIRNACREGFSRSTEAIGWEQQKAWWARMRNRVNAYLYRDEGGSLVGFGALIQDDDDGRWFSSCAVLSKYAGQGYGKRILSHLIGSVDHEVYAQARHDNPAAVALHNAVEWTEAGADSAVVRFRTRPKVRVAHGVSAEDYR